MPGLSSETIAELIAAPIEKQLAALEDLPLIESISTEGQVEFQLHTKTGCNLKQVESLIADRIAALKDSLPQSIGDTGFQIQAKTTPLFVVAVFSPDGKQDTVFLSNYVKTQIRDQLTHVPGVGQVTVFGTSPAGDDVTIKQHPGVALLLAPTIDAKPTDVATELKQRLAELRTYLPEGMVITLAINAVDMPDPRETHQLLEVQLPPGADASRRSLELSNVNTRLRDLPGIKSWVSFTRHPLETGNENPCVLLHAAATDPAEAQKKVRAAIKELLASNVGITFQLKTFGKSDATVIRAAVSGPDVSVADDLAGKLADRLEESRSYNAAQLRSPTAIKPRINVNLNRSKMAAHGITSAEISAALEATLGQPPHEDAVREQINIPDTPQPATAAALGQCRVKNAMGNEIALGDLATIEAIPAKLVVYRVNKQPAVLLAVQMVGDQNPKDAREQIGSLFSAARGSVTLGDEYKLLWLEE